MSLKSGKKYLQEVPIHCQSMSFCLEHSWGGLPNLSLWTFMLLLFWACYVKLVSNFSCSWRRCWKAPYPFIIIVCTWHVVGSPFGSLDDWRKWSCSLVNRVEEEVCINFTDTIELGFTPVSLCITWSHDYCNLTDVSITAGDRLEVSSRFPWAISGELKYWHT